MNTQIINSELGIVRLLEIVEERRKIHRSEPYVNYLATPQQSRPGQTSGGTRLLQGEETGRSVSDLISELDELPAGIFLDAYIRRY